MIGAYAVTGPDGNVVLQASENCRYARSVELALMDAGYTIRLNGKKITKKACKAMQGGKV